jgi:hypothetical protein
MGQNRSQTGTTGQQDKTMNQQDFNTWQGNTATRNFQDTTMNQDKNQTQTNRSQNQDTTMRQNRPAAQGTSQRLDQNQTEDHTMAQNKSQGQQGRSTTSMTDHNEMRDKNQTNYTMGQNNTQDQQGRATTSGMKDHNEMRGTSQWTGTQDATSSTKSSTMNDKNLKNDLYTESEGTSKMERTGQTSMRDTTNMSNNNLNFSNVGADTVNDAKMRQNKGSTTDQSKLYNTHTNAGIGSESLNPGKTDANKFNDTTMKTKTASDFTKKETTDRSNRWNEPTKLTDTKSKTDTTNKIEKKTDTGDRIDESAVGL